MSDNLSDSQKDSISVGYRSFGIGVWGVVLRAAGMPLEKIALEANSSRVSGKGQLQQAVKLVFADGAMAPYRVVRMASCYAWMAQYSIMGFVYQVADRTMSKAFGVEKQIYGDQVFESDAQEAERKLGQPPKTVSDSLMFAAKSVAAPIVSGSIESLVSNGAEVQRYYGPKELEVLMAKIKTQANGEMRANVYKNPLSRFAGPAFGANVMRNYIMCTTTFIFTPTLFRMVYKDEDRTSANMLKFGMALNIFGGNVVAISQQALWGRSLDYLVANPTKGISYQAVVKHGLKQDGAAAFWTPAKWFARVLMNAPAQGTIPWYYNDILPIFEPYVVGPIGSVYGMFGGGAKKE